MGAVTAADYDELVKTDEEFVDGLWDVVFRNDALIGRVIPLRGDGWGKYKRVNLVTAANTSVQSYQEGQTAPSRGKQTYATAKFAYRSWRVMVGETGHALRNRGPNSEHLRGGPDTEIRLAMRDLRDKMTTDFLAAGQTYSVDGIVNNATVNFGDLSRTTHAALLSYLLNASSATPSTALINKAKWFSKEAPYGSRIEVWLSSATIGGNLAEVASGKLALNDIGGGMANIIPEDVAAAQNIISVPDMLTSTMIGLSDVDNTWGYTNNEVGTMAGENGAVFRTRLYGSQDDSDTLQISTAGAVWSTQPQRQVKIYGLSTAL